MKGHEIDTDTSTHDLMNDATEWLQHARGVTGLLSDLVHEAEEVDCQKMACALDAIAALIRMGLQCTAHAHARMAWEQAKRVD